jgi:CRISPR-associated protein Csx14
MKTAVIAPLGLSPPIVTAGTDSAGIPITDLVVIATNDAKVLEGLDLIYVAMSIRAPEIHIHPEVLPFDDVNTTEQNFILMDRIKKVIKREREEHGCERILLNVAGGRKNVCITLALIGQLMNVDGVFHIVNKKIRIINQNLELLRGEIARLHKASTLEEKQAIYREEEARFNHLLYPPRSDYELVRLPTFPVDESPIQELIIALSEENIETIPLEDRINLERHGILEKGRTHYYLSDYGRRFLKAFH